MAASSIVSWNFAGAGNGGSCGVQISACAKPRVIVHAGQGTIPSGNLT